MKQFDPQLSTSLGQHFSLYIRIHVTGSYVFSSFTIQKQSPFTYVETMKLKTQKMIAFYTAINHDHYD